ncbi:MAG: nucleoside deaminase [bacterium]
MKSIDNDTDIQFMREALNEARVGLNEGEVPIGAVAVSDGVIIASGHNRRRALNDITAHAEMICLRELSPHLKELNLSGITIYSTLEPCAMCAGAMIHYRADRIVYGARDLKHGASGSVYNFPSEAGIPVTQGICEKECREILYEFIEHELGSESKTWEDIELE